MPNETPEFSKDNPNMPLYMGDKVATFKEAFEATGYKVEDVTKIIVTHKHPDHTGELRMFPNAKIYISETEADNGKCLRQVGTYQYEAKNGVMKTVPAVEIK